MPILRLRSKFPYRLSAVIQSHGWSDLAPFHVLNKDAIQMGLRLGGSAVDCEVRAIKGGVSVKSDVNHPELTSSIRHMFRLDGDLGPFYAHAKKHRRAWIASRHMGRMLRSQTIFEDMVKMILTTNCSWAFTKKMVQSLSDHLGKPTQSGRRLFPAPETLASRREKFYREKIRAGYRSPHLPLLGKLFSKGHVDYLSWLDSNRSTIDIRKEILSLPGAGPYVADNLLKLLGRFDYLGIDSWVRKKLGMNDKQIQKTYAVHGPYQGMILWCDVTKDWL